MKKSLFLKGTIFLLLFTLCFASIAIAAESPTAEITVYLSDVSSVSGNTSEFSGSISRNSNVLYIDQTHDFKVGQGICIEGAGNDWENNGWLVTSIIAVGNSYVRIRNNASMSAQGSIYHDDTAAINKFTKLYADNYIFDIGAAYVSYINLYSNNNYYGEKEFYVMTAPYMSNPEYVNGVFRVYDQENIVINGFNIDNGNQRGVVSNKMYGISSIFIINSRNITVSDNYIINNDYVAIQIVGENSDLVIINNDIIDTDVGVEAIAEWQKSLRLDNILIKDNYIDGGTSEGISIESGMYDYRNGYAKNIVITGNTVFNKESVGIFYGSRTYDSEISDNVVFRCLNGIATRDLALEPIESLISNNITIQGNVIDECVWMGLSLEGDNIQVIDNYFNETVEAMMVGISGPVSNVNIMSNTFSNCSPDFAQNIMLEQCSYIDITKNLFYSDKNYFVSVNIHSEQASNIKINKNTMYDGAYVQVDYSVSNVETIEIAYNFMGSITYAGRSSNDFRNLDISVTGNIYQYPSFDWSIGSSNY